MNHAVLAVLFDAQPVVSLTGLQLILAIMGLVLGSGGIAALMGPIIAARTAKLQVKGTLTQAEIESGDKTQLQLWEEIEKLRQRCDVKDERLAKLVQDYADLRAEYAELKRSNEEVVKNSTDLRSQHSELQGQLDQLKAKYADLEERNRVLDEDAAGREERISFLEAENASLRADLDQLRAAQGVHNTSVDQKFSDMHTATDPEVGGDA